MNPTDTERLDFLFDALFRPGEAEDDPDITIVATCVAGGMAPRDALDTAIKASKARG